MLGTDFHTQAGITIDRSHFEMEVRNNIFGHRPTRFSLGVFFSVFPRSELYTMLPIGPGCSIGLFELADSLYQSLNFYAVRSLVQPQQGEVPVRLVNPSMHIVTLEPRTMIGKVTSTTGVGSMTLLREFTICNIGHYSYSKEVCAQVWMHHSTLSCYESIPSEYYPALAPTS